MTPPRTNARPLTRYSPKPRSDYRRDTPRVSIGPAASSMLDTDEAWNLAWLSFDYDKSLQHPDTSFTVHVRATCQMQLNGGGEDVGRMLPRSELVASLLLLPAPRFVYLIEQHPVLPTLPLYLAYGDEWLETIRERSWKSHSEAWLSKVTDTSAAVALLDSFRLK